MSAGGRSAKANTNIKIRQRRFSGIPVYPRRKILKQVSNHLLVGKRLKGRVHAVGLRQGLESASESESDESEDNWPCYAQR